MNKFDETKAKIVEQLLNITPEQINEIKSLMDEQYDDVDWIEQAADYDCFLVESNLVETGLVWELVVHAMKLRDRKIKDLLARDMSLVNSWFIGERFEERLNETAASRI